MRNNSDTFDQYNQNPQRELRLVVVIEFPTPVYLASHGDISGLPAGALAGVLAKVSSTSQRLIPEAGRAEIGAINFELVDVGGVFTDTLRNQLQAGNGIKGRTVRLYQGGAGMDWADFRLEQTQVAEESLGYDHGRYRVRCRDIQREMRKDIFVPRATRLAADFLKGAGTLQVFSTADFEPCAHPASFGDAPGQTVYYLKIKYQNGWEVVRATGKTGTTFTGITRGLFGTVEYDHTVPTDNGDDKGIEVEEYIYLELPAPAFVYALLTGTMPGTANTLPSNWHLGIDPAYVVLDEFESIGSDWFDPADYSKGVVLRFDGLDKTDGKKFIEQEINLLLGAYMPVNAAGQLGYRRMAGVLADAGSVATITADDVVSLGELQQDLSALRNIFSVQWAWYEAPGFDGRFLRSNVLADAASIAVHGEAKPQALKFRGLHNSRHTFTTLKNRFDALRDRFAGPPLRLRLGLLPSNNDIEVGDVVRVRLPQVRDYTSAQKASIDIDAGDDVWGFALPAIPVDTARVYRVRFTVEQLRDDPTGENGVYAGVVTLDENFANIVGGAGTHRYCAASGTDLGVADGLRTYEGTISGEGDLHSNFRPGTVYARPMFIVNYNEGTGHARVYGLEFTDVTDPANPVPLFFGNRKQHFNLITDGGGWWTGETIPSTAPAGVADLPGGSLDRAMEVQRISVDQTSGSVQVELFGSTQKASAITDEDAGTSAELPDGWYSAAGTEMTAAGLSIDGSGFLTADGTLNGAASSRTSFYYLGDLTIPAGRTLTVTGNVQLNVMGVLQVDGDVIGAPSNGGAGFIGSCRGGHGQLRGQFNVTSYPYRGSRGEVVAGRNEVLPPLTIDNDGGVLVGIPADLRGSGGADGGSSYYYSASEAAIIAGGAGGAGGDGGAGVVVVARGIAIGVAGRIDTSGSAGAAGTAFFESPVAGGSGGGGAPGGVLLIIDGHQNPQPVLTNSKLVACYGDSPASPGNAGLGGSCLGVNAARVYTVPKSRSPYPNYTQDPEISAEVQQALADAAAAQQAAADAQSDATAALADLDDIAADGKLHPSEKLRAVLEYNRLTAEQAGIVATGNGYALTSEVADYTSALSALTGYLGGLTPDWDDTSAVTSISRTLWNSNWQAVFDARQALLDAVATTAGTRADWAQIFGADKPADNADVTDYGNPAINSGAEVPDGAALTSGDLQFFANRSSKSSNPNSAVGEVGLTAGHIIDAAGVRRDKTAVTVNTPFEGTHTYRGLFYIMWSDTVTSTRFTSDFGNNNYFVATCDLDGENWVAWPNVGNSVAFTPLASDLVLAVGTRVGDSAGITSVKSLLRPTGGLMRHTGGGVYTGDLDATHGATAAQAAAIVAAQGAADDAQADASAALGELDDIAADGWLTADEKRAAEREWGEITAEQSSIGAQAALFGLTTLDGSYDSAISSLSSYLGGLSPAWNDKTQPTSISRSLWNSNWQAVYTARQAILDEIANLVEAGVNPTANLLRNPSAERGTIFWNGSNLQTLQGGDGYQFRMSGFSGATWVATSDKFGFPAGRRIYVALEMYSSATAGTVACDVQFYNSGGTLIRDGNDAIASNTSTWHRKAFTDVAPTGTTHVAIRLFVASATGATAAWRRIMVTQSGYPMPFQDTLAVERDQRNLGQVIGSVQAGTAQTALSAADVGSFPRISIAAHVVQYGDFTVSYNSGSIDVSFFNTKYYVYVDDPDYKGGAVTYLTSTNPLDPIKVSGRRYLGTVTTPSNGGGSTGGQLPGSDCLVEGTWLRPGLVVDELRVGEVIDCWDEGAAALFPRRVRYVQRVAGQPSVLLTTASGAQKAVSACTPITTAGGDSVLAKDAHGETIAVQHDGQPLGWETITAVDEIGPQTVYHLNVGGISVAGGVDPAHRIVTHNAYKP